MLVHFITHPDVVIDPAVPVPDWPLSARDQPPTAAGGFRFVFKADTRTVRHGWERIDG